MTGFYVKRTRTPVVVLGLPCPSCRRVHAREVPSECLALQVGWTGPSPTEARAEREAAAWRDVDMLSQVTGEYVPAGWDAVVFEGSPQIRKAANDWQREADRKHGR